MVSLHPCSTSRNLYICLYRHGFKKSSELKFVYKIIFSLYQVYLIKFLPSNPIDIKNLSYVCFILFLWKRFWGQRKCWVRNNKNSRCFKLPKMARQYTVIILKSILLYFSERHLYFTYRHVSIFKVFLSSGHFYIWLWNDQKII